MFMVGKILGRLTCIYLRKESGYRVGLSFVFLILFSPTVHCLPRVSCTLLSWRAPVLYTCTPYAQNAQKEGPIVLKIMHITITHQSGLFT